MDWLPKPGTVLVQRYRLEKQVGRGAHGVVFAARDQESGEICALKFFHPELLESGRKETLDALRLRVELDSPRLLPIWDVIATKGTVALVEPFLELLTLRESARLDLEGTDSMSPLECVRLLTDLEEALSVVHEQGVHGNVKPENIFLSEDGYVLAHPYHVPRIHTLKWSAGYERLQQNYFAPEQILAQEPVTKSADTFAVAMVVGEVLAGGRVKDGLPLSVQTNQEINEKIDELFVRATNRDPEVRPDLKTFVRDLSEAMVSFTEEKENFNQDITLVSGVPVISDEMAADLESGMSHDEVLRRARERRQEDLDHEDTSPERGSMDDEEGKLGTTQPLGHLSVFGEIQSVGSATVLGGADLPANAKALLKSSIAECAKEWNTTFELAVSATGKGPPGLRASVTRRDTEDFDYLEIDEADSDEETSLMKAPPMSEVSFADLDDDIEVRAVAVEKVLSAIDAESMSTSKDEEDDRFLSIDVLDSVSIPEAIHELENPTIEVSLLEEDGDFEFEELEGDEAPVTDELEAQVVAEADELLAGFDGTGSDDVEFVAFEDLGFEAPLELDSQDFVAIDVDEEAIEIDDEVEEEIARTVKVEIIGDAAEVLMRDNEPSLTATMADLSKRTKRATAPQVPAARLDNRRLVPRSSNRSVYLWAIVGIVATFVVTIVALILVNQGGSFDGEGLLLTQRGPNASPTIIPEKLAPEALVVTDEGSAGKDQGAPASDSGAAGSDPGMTGAVVAEDVSQSGIDSGQEEGKDTLGMDIQLPDTGAMSSSDAVAQVEENDVTSSPNKDQGAASVDTGSKAAVVEEPSPQPEQAATQCVEGFASIEGAFCMQTHEYPGAGQKPKTRVTYAQAEELCGAQGARLCTVPEFKQACGNKYPYGKRFRRKRCNVVGEFFEPGRVFKTGAKAKCVSKHGIFDMSGNVAEWVEGGRTIGGSVKQEGRNVSCTKSKKRKEKYKSSVVGFRCCTDLSAP